LVCGGEPGVRGTGVRVTPDGQYVVTLVDGNGRKALGRAEVGLKLADESAGAAKLRDLLVRARLRAL
jgi:hypothetical protein